MKKINFKIIIIIIFTSIFFVSFGTASKQNIIEGIRKEKEATDKLKMRVKVVEDMDISTEGGELKYYYYDNTLKKIVALLYYETGILYSEYYIKDNKVYFIYEKRTMREQWSSSEKPKILKIEETRYYLDGNKKVIRYIDEKGKIHESGPVFNEKAEELKKYKLEYLKEMM